MKNTKIETIGNCDLCGNVTVVHEIIENKDGHQKVTLVCDECIDWAEDIISEVESIKNV